MRSGPHGGSHTQLIRVDPAIPSSALVVCSSITSVSGQAGDVKVMSMTTSAPSSVMP